MIDGNGPGAVTLGEEDRTLGVAAVKAVLRVASSDENALVATFVESALGLAEHFTGQVLIARTMRDRMPVSAAWQRIGAGPVRAIAGVESVSGTTLAASAYAVDIDAAGDGWVRTINGAGATQVVAVFSAGLAANWAGLAAPLRQGVVLLAAHLFEARDSYGSVSAGAAPPPVAVTALWRPFRRMTLSAGARAC